MKKLIGIVLAVLFLTTGIAAATDVTLSGSFFVRGLYFDNVSGEGHKAGDPVYAWEDADEDPTTADTWEEQTAAVAADAEESEPFGAYDMELSVDATWQIDDATKVFARFEMRDQTWGAEGTKEENTNHTSADDNIVVERVWGSHKFAATGGTLTVGLMGAGEWGTAFGDTGYDAYRIKYAQPIAIGTLIAIIQKLGEGGSEIASDDDDTDYDAYCLGLIAKAGDINIKPLFVYLDHETSGGSGVKMYLAVDGSFGNVSFEGEGAYLSFDDDLSAALSYSDDADMWGLYGKVFFDAGAANIEVFGAYGSYDEDTGASFDYGEEFYAGGWSWLLGYGWDMGLHDGGGLNSGYLLGAAVSFAATEQLTINGYVGYWNALSDYEDVYGYENAVEVNATASYAVTENLSYSFGLAWAQLEMDIDTDDSLIAYHKLAFSF